MSEIRFRCPNCTESIAVPQELAGQEVYCRYCYRKLTVPSRSEPDRRVKTGELYAIDDGPQDARARGQKFYLPEYRCPICNAAIPVAHDEIGVKKFCPDCDTPFSVTAEWYEEKRRQRRQEQMRSWTDPAIRLHPERYPEMNAAREVYGVSPLDASKASELVHWPESKGESVTTVCPVCRSILYIEKSQVGSKVRCPDCAAPFKVTQKWYDSRRKVQKTQKKNTQEPEREPAAPTPTAFSCAAPPPTAPKGTEFAPAASQLLPFHCAHCGGLIYLGESRIGKKIRCSDCGAGFLLTEKKFEEIRRRAQSRSARLRYGGAYASPKPSLSPTSPVFAGGGNAPPAVPPQRPKVPRPPEKKMIPVLCGLCGTLMYAEESQVGKQIRCPDCETYTTVTRPLNAVEPVEPSLGEGYGISDKTAEPDAPTVIEPTFTGGYDLAEPYDSQEENASGAGEGPGNRPGV